MRILITGGAGFIGSHLAEMYLADGHEVTIVDDFSSGKHEHIPHGVRIFGGDIREKDLLEQVFAAAVPQVVSHHAAVSTLARCEKSPRDAFSVNVIGTRELLDLSREFGVKKFLFASSAAVYGEHSTLPVQEQVRLKPISVYGVTKLHAEELIQSYAVESPLSATIFRYGNVYGPRQYCDGENGVVPIFLEALKSQKQAAIFGDGTKTRDYAFISDIVEANRRALTEKSEGVFNIGTGKETRDLDVFETVAMALRATGKPAFNPARPGEISNIALDWSHAKESLGWEPKISFPEGVRKTSDWYCALYGC